MEQEHYTRDRGKKWFEFRETILERDNYVCRTCPSKKSLHVHHRKPWSEYPDYRYDPDNCTTLCAKCHEKIHPWMRKKRIHKQAQTNAATWLHHIGEPQEKDKEKKKWRKRVNKACRCILVQLNSGTLVQTKTEVNTALRSKCTKNARKQAWQDLCDLREVVLLRDGRCASVGRINKLSYVARAGIPEAIRKEYISAVKFIMEE